ncbi:MAG TPA: hypothetical protein VM182_03335 [Terriglobia bacterium]|nr:hypothetical protein [Terriglobia bacterium]
MMSKRNDRGVSLVETMIAVLVAFITMSSLGGAIFIAMVTNKNQGTETTRMTALAREKIEQLTRLSYSNTTTNTTLITDTGWNVGLTSNSFSDVTQLSACPLSGDPNVGYVDFLNTNSQPLAGACSAAIASGYGYERRWRIADVSGVTGLKQISVVVYAPNAVRAGGAMPTVAVTTFKSQ